MEKRPAVGKHLSPLFASASMTAAGFVTILMLAWHHIARSRKWWLRSVLPNNQILEKFALWILPVFVVMEQNLVVELPITVTSASATGESGNATLPTPVCSHRAALKNGLCRWSLVLLSGKAPVVGTRQVNVVALAAAGTANLTNQQCYKRLHSWLADSDENVSFAFNIWHDVSTALQKEKNIVC